MPAHDCLSITVLYPSPHCGQKIGPFLNLNPGQEVGLYLFPVPVLFFLRDSCSEIVHPDNGAVVGIVHCVPCFQAVLCF